jgi:hypothetical protein
LWRDWRVIISLCATEPQALATSNYCAMFDPFQGIKHRATFSLPLPSANGRPKCPVSRMRPHPVGEIRRYDNEV